MGVMGLEGEAKRQLEMRRGSRSGRWVESGSRAGVETESESRVSVRESVSVGRASLEAPFEPAPL